MSGTEFDTSDALAALQDKIVEVGGEPKVKVDVDGRRHTVELRPIFQFENDILDRLIEPKTDNSVTGGAIPIKGEWIYGWLEVQGEDYINNIWKNYQYFLKYIEARTSVIGNISTHKRSPGTYNSMYRYLIILEELELLERFRRETVPEDEYDFPVPEEFRTRTFIRLTSDFEKEKDKWNNPYDALYPGGESVPDEDEEDEAVEIPIEPMMPEEEEESEPSEIPEDIEGMMGEPQEQEEDEEEVSDEVQGLGAFTGDDEDEEPEEVSEDFQMPEENASFADFPQKEGIKLLAENSFPEAIERTFEDAPIPTRQVEPEDFALGRMVVFGTWAVGEARPGQSPLELVVSVDDTSAEISPGFVPLGIQEHLDSVMRENNPYRDIFPDFIIISAFNSAFKRKIDQVVRGEQTELVYYDLQDMEFKEL